VRVYQFRHFGSFGSMSKTSCGPRILRVVRGGNASCHSFNQSMYYFFFVGAGDGASTVDVGTAAGAAGAGVGVAAGVGVGA
jgi:hypothetical protein